MFSWMSFVFKTFVYVNIPHTQVIDSFLWIILFNIYACKLIQKVVLRVTGYDKWICKGSVFLLPVNDSW